MVNITGCTGDTAFSSSVYSGYGSMAKPITSTTRGIGSVTDILLKYKSGISLSKGSANFLDRVILKSFGSKMFQIRQDGLRNSLS